MSSPHRRRRFASCHRSCHRESSWLSGRHFVVIVSSSLPSSSCHRVIVFVIIAAAVAAATAAAIVVVDVMFSSPSSLCVVIDKHRRHLRRVVALSLSSSYHVKSHPVASLPLYRCRHCCRRLVAWPSSLSRCVTSTSSSSPRHGVVNIVALSPSSSLRRVA